MSNSVEHFDERLQVLLKAAMEEDLGDGDHSTLAVIPADVRGKARLKIKQDGILAGVEIAEKIFCFREPAAIFQVHKKDGETVRAGDSAFIVEASVHTILSCERIVLNCAE